MEARKPTEPGEKRPEYEAPEVETVMNREELGRDVHYAADTFSDSAPT
jgi:hypothetical protein